jgi:lysine--tRNA ligase
MEVNGSSTVVVNDTPISFAPPYRQIDVTEELTRQLGPLPDLNTGDDN